jgi:hypothetical protein
MTAKWAICGILLALLFVSAGCRTRQPNVKPDTTAEQFIEPPPGTYSTTGMPRAAFDKAVDPGRMAIDAKGPGTMPTRGSGMGAPGAGGMGGMQQR